MPGAVVTNHNDAAVDVLEQARIWLDSAHLSAMTAVLDLRAITRRPWFVTCHVIVRSMQRRSQDGYHALLLSRRYLGVERQAEDLVGRALSARK